MESACHRSGGEASAAGALTAILSAVSWRFIEKPALSWKRWIISAKPKATVKAGAATGGRITVLAFNLVGDGLRDALDPNTPVRTP
jgi:hypothetical protein